MSYFPKIVDPAEKDLDILDLIQEKYWHRIKFDKINPGDRILAIRMFNGVRTVSEGVVDHFVRSRGIWVNSMDAPVVSCLDYQIFRSGEPRDDQYEEDSANQLIG